MAPSGNEKEKKSRWRSMLGGGRDKEEEANQFRPGPSPKDSAYGSEGTATSDQQSARPQSAEPSETKVQQDPSTGNIVTTTVTTTTTTTTVTTNKGEHIKTESTPTVEADATARVGDSDESGSTSTPARANPAHEQYRQAPNTSNQNNSNPPGNQHHRGPDRPHPNAHLPNPAELDAAVPGAASAEENGPALPAKSNRRISREMGSQPRPISEVTEPPVSPITTPSQHNFSYPARTPPPQGQPANHEQQPYPGQLFHQDQQPNHEQQPYHGQPFHQGQQPYQDQQPFHQGGQTYPGQPQHHSEAPYAGSNMGPNSMNRQGERIGTLQNLKTAAAGIHGAGETLRGTFNSSLDRNFGRAAPEKIAAHDQVVSAGKSEIETGKFHESAREREKLKGKGKFGGVLRKPVGNSGS